MVFLERRPAVRSGWADIIAPGRLADDRLHVRVGQLNSGETWEFTASQTGLSWLHVLEGHLRGTDHDITPDHVAMIARGRSIILTSEGDSTVLVAEVPRAAEYDPHLGSGLVVNDWTREPVLVSEHDARERIYLATPGLWGTNAVKGEMITYPPGARGASHHHQGAEHFQYIVSGRGAADTPAGRLDLRSGDLVYNFENEVHSFENDYDEPMTFVEFFVPGESTTVWAPGEHACTWQPTGHDIRGRTPQRHIARHVHGEGEV